MRTILGALVALVLFVFAVDDFRDRNRQPETLADCFASIDPSESLEESAVEAWYCETQYANIWAADYPLTMLESNMELILSAGVRTRLVSPVGDDTATISDSSTDSNWQGGLMSRLWTRWPYYENRSFFVQGQLAAVQSLDESTWVVQMRSASQDSELLYARLSTPQGWSPPARGDCRLGWIEGVPIARGYASRQSGDGVADTIYMIASTFTCLPFISEEEFDELETQTPRSATKYR